MLQRKCRISASITSVRRQQNSATARAVLLFPTSYVAGCEESSIGDVLAASLSGNEMRTRAELKGDVLRLLDTAQRLGARRTRVMSLKRRVTRGTAHCLELEQLDRRMRSWLSRRRDASARDRLKW